MAAEAHDIPQLIDVEELAQLLAISPEILRARASRGEIPGTVKLSPKTVRFRRDEIHAWIEQQTTTRVVAGTEG